LGWHLARAGSCVGLFLALRGIGRNTVPDIIYHVGLVALLLFCVVIVSRVETTAQVAHSE